MNKTTKTIIAFIMACCAIPAGAGAIHTWASGATLTSGDLNANFQHIHNLMVGGHGARLVDADVSGSANIASSKLTAYRFIPRAWGIMTYGSACTGGTCTLQASEGVTSVTYFGSSSYTVTLSYMATDPNYMILVNGIGSNVCMPLTSSTPTTTTFRVHCYDWAGANADSAFSFVVYDDN